jgi:hypothetical protein
MLVSMRNCQRHHIYTEHRLELFVRIGEIAVEEVVAAWYMEQLYNDC